MGKNPSHFSKFKGVSNKKVVRIDTSNFPVESVTWNGAVEFCKRLSALPEEIAAGRVYALPTEAEWEYACRGGAASSTPFHFGISLSASQANFTTKGRHLGHTAKVGSYPQNAFGLYDMHGNVAEWCADWYDSAYYKVSPRKDPAGPIASPENCRVVRGGAWSTDSANCRSARRFRNESRNSKTGFRVVFRPGAKTP